MTVRSGESRTGGRQPTLRHIPGDLAIAVGMPNDQPAPLGWRWVALTEVARMESGHTPSRRHPEYWGGNIPWLSIKDAKAHHGVVIQDTIEHTNELGLANSSARLLPTNTVCLSRTASIGYVVVLGRPMATSQDFVNWICTDHLIPRFLMWLFLAEQDALLRFSSGAVHPTIYYPEAKALHICIPSPRDQHRIVTILDKAFATIDIAVANAERKLALLGTLREAVLHKAFRSQSQSEHSPLIQIPSVTTIEGISPTDLHAGILAIAYRAHESQGSLDDFGHVKGEKIAHMIEAYIGVDLGRTPVKDAAGPNDYPHLKKVEHRASKANWFEVKRRGDKYDLTPKSGFDHLIQKATTALADHSRAVDRLIRLMLPMDTRQSEIFATIFAAWNNLLLDGNTPSDDQIVYEARENWHLDKRKIPRESFFKAIGWIRDKGIIPQGRGKRVSEKTS